MGSLLEKLSKSTKIKHAGVLSESKLFSEKDTIPTDIPAINIALSGEIDGGLRPGCTSIAGLSRHFKSSYALLMASAYMKRHPDGMILFYDSEFGSTEDYFKSFNIDPAKVLHIPITNIEELKFDLMQKLDNENENGIKRNDKVFVLIDSIGNLASVKEANDAISGNTAQDMSRPKMLKSFFRLVTPHLNLKNIPMVAIQHVYSEMGLYPKTIMSGGQGGMLSSDTVWIISRSQEKEGTELVGYNFTITVDKSRTVKEKSRIPITVKFDGGISKYSAILDLALESGDVIKPSNGWYQLVDKETGEMIGGKVRSADTETDAFLGVVLKRQGFKDFVKDKYKLAQGQMVESDEESLET